MRTCKIYSIQLAIFLLLLNSSAVWARQQAKVVVPDSSMENAGDFGKRAHTHFRMLMPAGTVGNFSVASAARPNIDTAPFSGYGFQTPASMACIYKLVGQATGCNPNSVTAVVSGGGKAMALVEAYDYPNAARDLQTFSNQFGLPSANLKVVYANGRRPHADPFGWEMEAALDLQWAHAMAPEAQLFLVEAPSASLADLLYAVNVAGKLVSAAGGGEVSMSWGMSEFAGETSYDNYFNASGVVYFASSGDSAGTSWPCVSKNVVCVGGTTLRVNSAGNFEQEVPWVDGGGGYSTIVGKPAYQTVSGNYRGVPDIALSADPNTGAWIYYTPSDFQEAGWWVVGGTSWSSPMAAAITNSAGKFNASSEAELSMLYSSSASTYLNDISIGWCGLNVGVTATSSWDQCTGLGSFAGY
ncbi:MAG: S53 family peptidase [Methylococcales bacterium]|nr:S53 family peptidase [Methylococcales bacterium]